MHSPAPRTSAPDPRRNQPARAMSELTIAAGALVLALVSADGVIATGLPALFAARGLTPISLTWPEILATAARALLWPFARLTGAAAGTAEPGPLALALAVYLALTLGGASLVMWLLRDV